MITDDKELNIVRWQFAWLYNICGGQRTLEPSLCTKKAGWGTKHTGRGRCKWHAGCSTGPTSEEGKIASRRAQMISKLKTGKFSKLSKDVFREAELDMYKAIMQFLFSEFEIDEIGADQIAVAIVYQKCYLIPKLQLGGDVDLNPTSDNIRRWLAEYKLTPKSKDAESITINLAQIIQEVHDKMELVEIENKSI
jgi:hypothetical protein